MIYLFRPFLSEETAEEVRKVIKSGYINRGKKAKEFEELLKKTFQFPYVHTVNSGTSALKLALKIAGVKRKSEVITTPWTMVATNTAILECGGKPVFVDIKYDSLNIDPQKIEEKLSKKTKAIMIVNYSGYPCDLDEIYKIGRKNGVEVIQDSAQALGAKYRGKWLGSFGNFSCFSFQAIKQLTMGDGGCLTTSSEEIYKEVVKRSWFGINKEERISTPIGKFPRDIETLGYKNNITDIDAAIGIAGLRKIDIPLKRRKEIGKIYTEELGNLEKIKLLNYKKDRESSFFTFPLHVEERESFARRMRKEGIEVSKLYERNDKYSLFGGIRSELKEMERAEKDIIHIPLHPYLREEEIDFILKTIKKWNRS